MTNIQIRARGKCPKCGERKWGRIVQGAGQEVCVDCEWEIAPAYFLDFFHQGKRMKVYSDDRGQVLDSWQRAAYLEDKIKFEIRDHTFDPSKYLRAEVQKYWIASLLDEFLRDKEKSIAPSYWPTYKCMAERARKQFSTKDVREIKRRDLVEYKNRLEENRDLGPKTIKNNLDLFRVFLNWCKGELELNNVVPTSPRIEIPEPKIKWLSGEEQRKLFQFIPEADRPIISFLMLSGCRPSEARALKVRDIDLRNESITIRGTFSGRVYREHRKGRGSSSVTIPIHQELLPYISGRVKNNLPGAWLFFNARNGDHYSENKLRRVWETIKAGAGIDGIRLYDATRHSFASQLINGGTPIYWVSKLLGHKELKTTERYSHCDLEGMRTSLEKLSLEKIISVHGLSTEEKEAKIAN